MKSKIAILLLCSSGFLLAQTDADKELNKALNPELSSEQVSQMVESRGRAAEALANSSIADIQVGLNSNSRKLDVFGGRIYDEVPTTVNAAETDALATERRNKAISAVQGLKIVGVAPGRSEFYVDSWIIHSGDSLTLRNGNNTFVFQISEITPESISFQDTESKLKIVAQLHILPDTGDTYLIAK